MALFTSKRPAKILPIEVITVQDFPAWQLQQDAYTTTWLSTSGFRAESGQYRIIPDDKGHCARVIVCVADATNVWGVGVLAANLPAGVYEFVAQKADLTACALAFGLGAYQFTRYKTGTPRLAQLYLPAAQQHIIDIVDAISLVRDCINTPADDMGPSQLAEVVERLAKDYHAKFAQIVGESLLQENYASIYTVGRASDDAPRLLDLRWGNARHPKVTLVGKGVCFDTGGLDLKPSAYMLLMKKDMGGAANVLGLARMIMAAKLPICLRVLIPAVENAVGGNAYRPGDVIKSRHGRTIEIGNTDAEGRVVLADALTEAVSEKPDLLIDISTLTGAARVALGTDLPAMFANDDALAAEVIAAGLATNDPMWRLPLHAGYRELINSSIADINNNASEPYGGAITAALFLQEFVPDDIPWLHFDMMAWNLRHRPGRPQGGEAMAIRALFAYLQQRFASKQ